MGIFDSKKDAQAIAAGMNKLGLKEHGEAFIEFGQTLHPNGAITRYEKRSIVQTREVNMQATGRRELEEVSEAFRISIAPPQQTRALSHRPVNDEEFRQLADSIRAEIKLVK